MISLLIFQGQGPVSGTRWRAIRMVVSRSGTSLELTLRKASRSRFSSGSSFMGSLLYRPGHGPGRQRLQIGRRLTLQSVPKIEPAQFLPAARQSRLHRRERDPLYFRNLCNRESFDVVEHDRLSLLWWQSRQGQGHTLRPASLLFPCLPVLSRRLGPPIEGAFDRNRLPPWTSHARAVSGEERGEEPGTKPGFVSQPVQLVVRPEHGLLVEVVTVVDGSAQPARRGHGLRVDRFQQADEPLPACRVVAGIHRVSCAPWFGYPDRRRLRRVWGLQKSSPDRGIEDTELR